MLKVDNKQINRQRGQKLYTPFIQFGAQTFELYNYTIMGRVPYFCTYDYYSQRVSQEYNYRTKNGECNYGILSFDISTVICGNYLI